MTSTSSTTQSPLFRRSVFSYLLLVVGLTWLFNEETKATPYGNSNNNYGGDDYHKMMMIGNNNNNNRCLDPGDPPDWNEIPNKKHCACPDPLKPSKREEVGGAWDLHHQVMVQDAEYAATLELEHGHELDVVMLGDSITERWNGTRSMGQNRHPEYRAVFERFFDKTNSNSNNDDNPNISIISSSSTTLQGLALGTSGDISAEMLWHLQNGMLPDTLRPKVWLLLIGTNDLGRSGCSKRTTLAGILQVAQYLHDTRASSSSRSGGRSRGSSTPIILHGLLPRNDVYRSEELQTDYFLNRYWQDILWINRELKKFCTLHENWYYMDANHLFLKKRMDNNDVDNGGDTQGAVMINRELMPDALHPNVAGYEAWGPLIVEQVLKLAQKE